MAIKVAVLGGGMAALTAAYELAVQKDAAGNNKFDITVYQMGWRLGGKGASGLNGAHNDRIEEHGLHIWFGAYHDAFRTMRQVYADRPDKWPCSQVRQHDPREWGRRSIEVAFQRQRYYYLMEHRRDGWKPWKLEFPSGNDVPGEKPGAFSASELIDRVEDWLAGHFATEFRSVNFHTAAGDLGLDFLSDNRNLIDGANFLRELADTPSSANLTQAERDRLATRYHKEIAIPLSRWMKPVVSGGNLAGNLLSLVGIRPELFTDLRRAWEAFDLGQAIIVGALRAGIVSDADWDRFNGEDLRAWLKRHVVDPASVDSALVTGCYDLFFSYAGGDTEKPVFEAGTALRAMMWLLTTYDGAIMWRMNAGMGDTIFAPLYNALKQHGVKFRFFHKVRSIGAGPGNTVGTVDIDIQATVTAGPDKYEPLRDDHRKMMSCWGECPDFNLLKEKAQLQPTWADNNFESDWSGWTAPGKTTLRAGIDFDEVILGIPIAASKSICQPLTTVQAGARLANMFATVQTVRTQAFQLWFDRDLSQLGTGLRKDLPILSTFDDPVDTYCDMSHLLDSENWPDPKPKHLAYFCGVMKDDPAQPAPGNVKGYAKGQTDLVKAEAVSMLTGAPGVPAAMAWIWPEAFRPAGVFDWNALRSTLAGPARMDEQFFRANIDAGERYVIAATGTSQHRLAAGASGFDNLFLAGDWIRNGLYVGCIEGTVRSGMQAAAAVRRKHP